MTIKVSGEFERRDGSGLPVAKSTRIGTDTTNFDNNLSSADDTVQKALDTLDNMDVGGGGSGLIVEETYTILLEGTTDALLLEDGTSYLLFDYRTPYGIGISQTGSLLLEGTTDKILCEGEFSDGRYSYKLVNRPD